MGKQTAARYPKVTPDPGKVDTRSAEAGPVPMARTQSRLLLIMGLTSSLVGNHPQTLKGPLHMVALGQSANPPSINF